MLNNGVYDGSIAAVLEEVRLTSDLEGLAVLDLSQPERECLVSYSAGVGGANTVATAHGLLAANPGSVAHMVASDKRPIMACPWLLPPSRPGGLVLWRGPRARRWTDTEHGLVASLAVLLRSSIETNTGGIGFDRLTGLPNRRWFINEVDRHIDRLDLDGQIGTLSLLDVDHLRRLNATLGQDAGDNILVRIASHLHATIRPGDILARVDGDAFAVWQSGMDHLTAAERADALGLAGLFNDLPTEHGVTFSIGIASRVLDSGEDVRALLRRAHMAARDVANGGGGGWRVSHSAPRRKRSDSQASDPTA